jgi:hypothetical protein
MKFVFLALTMMLALAAKADVNDFRDPDWRGPGWGGPHGPGPGWGPHGPGPGWGPHGPGPGWGPHVPGPGWGGPHGPGPGWGPRPPMPPPPPVWGHDWTCTAVGNFCDQFGNRSFSNWAGYGRDQFQAEDEAMRQCQWARAEGCQITQCF